MPDDRRVNGSGSCRVDIVVASDGDRVKYNSYCRRIVVAIGANAKWCIRKMAIAFVDTCVNNGYLTQSADDQHLFSAIFTTSIMNVLARW